ncbi:pilus assembly protein N-terminal domain-containing protein [candidate division CSSED10-310 bacterium]|uniref:Pilus assembly protein N-terminal domain-containing protein n=1 Tax=candidate division CSSED10-310 bacterium TaxID=2855610 RepID=A0ABV6YX73_UNCC1
MNKSVSARFSLWLLFILLVSLLLINNALSMSKLTLVKGSNKPLSTDFDIGKIAIGDPGVCDFVVASTRREVILSPKSRGSTNLILWDNEGQKRDSIEIVVVENIRRLAEDLRQLFRDIEGVEIKQTESKIILGGNVFSETDFNYIKEAVQGTPELIQFRISLDPEALKLLAREIEKSVQRAEITVRVIKDMILLEGFVFNKFEYTRAEKIAKTYSPARIINALEIKDKKDGRAYREAKLIHFDVKFLEIADNDFSKFGINWSDSIVAYDETVLYQHHGDDPTTSWDESKTDIFGRTEGIITGILPSLDILVRDGGAKQIANPRLICKSGEKAREVVDGGLYPVIVITQLEIKIEYHEFGIIVELEPIVNEDQSVDTKIKVSLIQIGRLIEKAGVSVPLFDLDEVETHVLLKAKETLILGGLINKKKQQEMSGLPGLSKIPLLKYLFGSKEKTWVSTQLVIFVTPTVVSAGATEVDVDVKLRKGIKMSLSLEDVFSID